MATVQTQPPDYIERNEPWQDDPALTAPRSANVTTQVQTDEDHDDEDKEEAGPTSENLISMRMFRGQRHGAIEVHDRVVLSAEDETISYYVDFPPKSWKDTAGVDCTLREGGKTGRPVAIISKGKKFEVELTDSGHRCLLTKTSLLARSQEFVGPAPDNAHFVWKMERMKQNWALVRRNGKEDKTIAIWRRPSYDGSWDGTLILDQSYEDQIPLVLGTAVAVCLWRQSKEGFGQNSAAGFGMGGGAAGGGGGGF